MNGIPGHLRPGGLWQEARNADGRVYYYNTQTKATQWTKPPELMTPAEVSCAQLLKSAGLIRATACPCRPAMERVYRRGRPQVLVQHGDQGQLVGDARGVSECARPDGPATKAAVSAVLLYATRF